MFRSLIFYPIAVISIFVAELSLVKAKYLERKNRMEERTLFLHKITHNWASRIIKLSGCKVHVEGLENIPEDKTVLFVANHQSYFDIPLLMSAIDVPKGFIAKKELEKLPGVSKWMRYIRCIFMDRDNLRKSAESIVEGIKILKSGYSMVIFPEGTRSQGRTHADFKAGSFKLATKSKAMIVPVTIDGTYKVMEEGKGKIKSTDLKLIIHPAIDTTTLSKEELAVLHETVQETVFEPLK